MIHTIPDHNSYANTTIRHERQSVFPHFYRSIVLVFVEPTPSRHHDSNNYPIVDGPLKNHYILKKAANFSPENCRYD